MFTTNPEETMASFLIVFALLLIFGATDAVQLQKDKPSLKWGTHRPGYYFGLRARHPRSPLFGFMWYDAGKYESISAARHACQDGDKLSTYGWHRHNGDDFGQQVLTIQCPHIHKHPSYTPIHIRDIIPSHFVK